MVDITGLQASDLVSDTKLATIDGLQDLFTYINNLAVAAGNIDSLDDGKVTYSKLIKTVKAIAKALKAIKPIIPDEGDDPESDPNPDESTEPDPSSDPDEGDSNS